MGRWGAWVTTEKQSWGQKDLALVALLWNQLFSLLFGEYAL